MVVDFEEQYDKIYRYCYFRLHNQQLAEDITQETILRFLENSTYRDMGRPLSYLYAIARNLCIDSYRKQREDALLSPVSQENFENEIIDKIALHHAMQSLSQQEQELLLLRYVNEMPMNELCRLYGKSRFSLYRELNKITKKLKRRLTDEI